MTDFVFYGRSVTLFSAALHGYRGYLVTHPSIEYPDAIDDVHELLSSGFDGACFSFYFTYVGLVVRSLQWYHDYILYKMRSCNDMKLCSDYSAVGSEVRTLIAQIDLMQECNDDD